MYLTSRLRLADTERDSRMSQVVLNPRYERMCATEHVPCGSCRLLERRHGLAEIDERAAGVLVDRARVEAGASSSASATSASRATSRSTIRGLSRRPRSRPTSRRTRTSTACSCARARRTRRRRATWSAASPRDSSRRTRPAGRSTSGPTTPRCCYCGPLPRVMYISSSTGTLG